MLVSIKTKPNKHPVVLDHQKLRAQDFAQKIIIDDLPLYDIDLNKVMAKMEKLMDLLERRMSDK